MIDIHLTVGEVLQKWPKAFSVFMKYKTKCPGCFLQHFCILKEVAETYQIPPQELILEIENVSTEKSKELSLSQTHYSTNHFKS